MEGLTKLILPGILIAVAGYLLGSVSFSILLTKIFKKDDIRNYGSGNAGATNVLRSAGKLPAALTFILDFSKCAVSVLIGYYVFLSVCNANGLPVSLAVAGKYAAGIGCMLGHIYPVYFGFRGGKGVVTAAALIALLDWRVFVPAITVFILIFAWKKIVSLGSVVGMTAYPIINFLVLFFFDYAGSPLQNHGTASFFYVMALTLGSLMISAIVIFVHRPNIKRLLKGEEKPISFGSKK